MELIHNKVFSILAGDLAGLYRVVFDEPELKKTIVVRLGDAPTFDPHPKVRSTSQPVAVANDSKKRKKKSRRLVGALLWLDHIELHSLDESHHLQSVDLALHGRYFDHAGPDCPKPTCPRALARLERKQQLVETRVRAMAPFLNLSQLRESILEHGNLSDLIARTSKKNPRKSKKKRTGARDDAAPMLDGAQGQEPLRISRGLSYKCWSLLCLYGFDESSLRLRFDRCGAPGVLRPCDPDGRKKAGAWTERQLGEKALGNPNPAPEQPGMSSEWRALIMMADARIPSPKPGWKQRYLDILRFAFVRRADGEAEGAPGIKPDKGEYPNNRQIKRVIEVDTPQLVMLRQKTTAGHFARSLRGLHGKNWEGVSGPGHTWAIDSTVGDNYLRSSINRAWVIGRPIVYVVVDVWSTAVVGFYVCLTGPSWAMAKISLFCSGADPQLISDLWGYTFIPTLAPYPTLPCVLMCDRGEYLSKGARQTGIDLQVNESYAPPYRPDLKGLVEVLHRIMKDEQFLFVPGAIDARRAEMELRKFDPRKAIFTMREYVQFLYVLFSNYNLTADRKHRLDAHMLAAGVIPSPAGLWRWGHQVGIGFRRDVSREKLITDLLPRASMSVTRNGASFARALYASEQTEADEWTAHARNFGATRTHCHYFPGTVSRIWTPNLNGNGIFDLRLSDHSTASPESTFDEVADTYKYSQRNNAEVAHHRTMTELDARMASQALIDQAQQLTGVALSQSSSPIPSLTSARALEAAPQVNVAPTGSHAPRSNAEADADDAYSQMMDDVLNGSIEAIHA